MAESYSNRYITLWEKEKLLVTSNFSFSRSVFKRLVSQERQKVSLCGNGLTPSFAQGQNFNLIQIQRACRRQLDSCSIAEMCLHLVEKIVGRAVNVGLQHFIYFLQCFIIIIFFFFQRLSHGRYNTGLSGKGLTFNPAKEVK